MSKKVYKKKSILSSILYMMVVILLVAGLGYVYQSYRNMQAERSAYRQSLIREESHSAASGDGK
jgi:flagellar basal body-associated protein FliL